MLKQPSAQTLWPCGARSLPQGARQGAAAQPCGRTAHPTACLLVDARRMDLISDFLIPNCLQTSPRYCIDAGIVSLSLERIGIAFRLPYDILTCGRPLIETSQKDTRVDGASPVFLADPRRVNLGKGSRGRPAPARQCFQYTSQIC